MIDPVHAITLGHPSYVWRAGQERRLQMVRRYAQLEGARILDVGCGLGLYVRAFAAYSPEVHGVDVDPERVAQASETLANIREAAAEALPYPDGYFDVVFSQRGARARARRPRRRARGLARAQARRPPGGLCAQSLVPL